MLYVVGRDSRLLFAYVRLPRKYENFTEYRQCALILSLYMTQTPLVTSDCTFEGAPILN